jgi:DNA-directed RNA polymerase specialized sigma24 family protein
MKESLDTWFKREILVHEGALVRYLTRTWSNRQEIHDLRQDTYVRVFEAAAKRFSLPPQGT